MARLLKVDGGVPSGESRCLPEVAFTRTGVAFRPNEPLWRWRAGPFQVHIDFARVNLPSTIPLFSLKYVLHVFAKSSSGSHLTNLYEAFIHFLRGRGTASPLRTITAEDVSNYVARLQKHETWRIGTLNVLLQMK